MHVLKSWSRASSLQLSLGALAAAALVAAAVIHFRETPPLPGDGACASLVRRHPWEPRPENRQANQTLPTEPVAFNVNPHWQGWRQKASRVTGNFTGTTDEVIQWAACKWGFDEHLVRALAFKESSWKQSAQGDYCADGTPRSFGIIQIRHGYCDGRLANGGHPWTLLSTALNLDYGLAILRACYEGDFYDGGPWLYGGQKIVGDLWGCVGFYYSGQWYDGGAKSYIAAVKPILAEKPWISQWGWPGEESEALAASDPD